MFEFKFGRRGYIPIYLLNPPPRVISTNIPLFIGCRVHLHSRNGTYIVHYYNERHVNITCQTWKSKKERGQRAYDHEIVSRSDIKCLHGHDKFR